MEYKGDAGQKEEVQGIQKNKWDRQEGMKMTREKQERKTGKGFPICSFPAWRNAPLYPGQ